jgi:hypothetical protein
MMKTRTSAWIRSLTTAGLIAMVVLVVSVGLIAPRLPRVVGRPEVRQQRSFTWDGVKTLRLKNAEGFVFVRTDSVDAVEAAADVQIYTRISGAREIAEQYAAELFHVHQSADGLLEVTTEPGQRPDELDLLVDYRITMPEGVNLEVENASGNLYVARGCGQVKVLGGNTDIIINSPQGPVNAQTTNGRIRLIAGGESHLTTVNGNVYAHIRQGSLIARTTNGLIEARLTPDVVSCDLTAHNGPITLEMPEDASARVYAETAYGEVRSDFPLSTGDSVRRRRLLEGTIGQGGADLRASTLNGNIWIKRSG